MSQVTQIQILRFPDIGTEIAELEKKISQRRRIRSKRRVIRDFAVKSERFTR
jgi:hypothetical protein